MTNSLCEVNAFPLQLHFSLLLHNEGELTVSTFSHCLDRRVDLFAVLFFFDYQPFPPSPLLLTPALGGQSLATIPASHQAHKAAESPVPFLCSGKGRGDPRGAASSARSWNKVYESPIKTKSRGAKKNRTVQRSLK